MPRAARRYTAKLKFQVVIEALKGEKTPGQIAKAYGVHANSVGIWKHWFLERGALLFERAELGREDLKRVAELEQLLGKKSRKIRQQNNEDIGANVASGSYPTDAMVVIPCSMGTLARIANGLAMKLIERAADVCLKEQRPLLLCVRETPLNKIHIRNMYRAADAGAVIFPLIPTFYNKPASQDEMARQFSSRVLAHIGLEQPDAYHWKG